MSTYCMPKIALVFSEILLLREFKKAIRLSESSTGGKE